MTTLIKLLSPSEVHAAALKESGLVLGNNEALNDYLRSKSLGHLVGTGTKRALDKLITLDHHMQQVKNAINLLAPENDPVLLLGETGTGKEILAHALHGDRKGAFVALNCAAVQDTLAESELCGYVRGAFTGAVDNSKGLLHQAGDGTIFLDEINSASPSFQAKLLRIIENRTFRQVGSTEEEEFKGRFVFASNAIDLSKVEGFRRDLFYRISTFTFKLKPLRERPGDVDLIAKANDYDPEIEAPIPPSCYAEANVRGLLAFIRRHKILGDLIKELD